MRKSNLSIFLLACSLLLATCNFLFAQNAQNKTKFQQKLPPTFKGNDTVDAVTNCSYSADKIDCSFGFDYGTGLKQNFLYNSPGDTLTLEGQLGNNANIPNKNMSIYFSHLDIKNYSTLIIKKFHSMQITGGLFLDNHSKLTLELAQKAANNQNVASPPAPQYGDSPKLMLTDLPYNDGYTDIISNGSTLEVKNGDILLGKRQVLIDESSVMRSSKDNGTSYGNIFNRGHIIVYGLLEADSDIKNGYSKGATDDVSGISSQDLSGRIDNYGVVKGNVTNNANSIFVFHSHNGKLSQIKGTLENQGRVIIDTRGAKYGLHHVLINGITKNGNGDNLENANISYSDGADEFILASIDSVDVNITLRKDNVDKFERGIKGTKKDVLHALDQKYNIYSYGGSKFVTKVIDDTTRGIWSNYLTMPLTLIDSLKPKINTSNSNVNIGTIGSGFFGKNIGIGGMGGINAGISKSYRNNLLQTQLAYGYGHTTNNLKFSKSEATGHIMMFSLMNRIMYDYGLEIDLGLHTSAGFFDTTQELGLVNTNDSKASSNFNLYSIIFDSNVGYKIRLNKYSIKPYTGFNQALNIQSKFKENGGLNISSNGYTSYNPSILVGIENKYTMSAKNTFSSQFSYEYTILNDLSKINFHSNSEKIILVTPYIHKLSLELGGSSAINTYMMITFNGFYKTNLDEIHSVGGNASFKYAF